MMEWDQGVLKSEQVPGGDLKSEHIQGWGGVQAPCRVATAQGKQGIWKSIFPDRENTGNLPKI